ncbi:helix-turn-helix domain-containing protein [Acidobacteriota bacterium]
MKSEKATLSNLGTCIREMRESKGLSRNALADMVSGRSKSKLSPTTLLSIESGQGANLRTIVRIAEALQVPVGSLFDCNESNAATGLRAFEQALQLFGYSAERYRSELRLDHEGGAFAVNTIEKLHSNWYSGPVKIWHGVTTRQQNLARLTMCEAPFEVLERPRDLPIEQEQWVLGQDKDERGVKQFKYEIGLPIGLGDGRVSYRYSFALTACYQMFGEISLIPDDAFNQYGEPPDIPPDDLRGLVAAVEKEFKCMSDQERKQLDPCFATLRCSEFPTEQLVLTVKFPNGCLPSLFEARCWLGMSGWTEPPKDLKKKLLTTENHLLYKDNLSSQLRLEINRPVMGVSYAVFWWPVAFEDYWDSYEVLQKEKG